MEPFFQLPPQYISLIERQEHSFCLMIVIVREEKINEKRFFYACEDMQFLPADANRNTEAVNPIHLRLNSLPINSDGTFQ